MTRYDEVRSQVISRLPNDGIRIGLALDSWSAKSRPGFIAIIVYWIDPS